jgi:hypothetical protein
MANMTFDRDTLRALADEGNEMALDRLADLAEDLHGQGQILWVAAPSQGPLEMLRRAAELLGRTDLQSDTGRLGVRLFPTLGEAVSATGTGRSPTAPRPDRPERLRARGRRSRPAAPGRSRRSGWPGSRR